MTAVFDDPEVEAEYQRAIAPPATDPTNDPAYLAAVDAEAERRFGPYDKPKPDTSRAKLPNLPEEFWQARQRFADIRQAAWHIGCGADVTFLTVLCRASAMVSPKLVFDLGRGIGSLNLFGGAIGDSGAGKSQSVEVGQDLLLAPSFLLDEEGEVDDDKFRDGVPLGTGEGIAEAFMGWKTKPTGEYTSQGKAKTEKVRAQVRQNVFYYLDEGETLSKMMMERQGTTIGQAIRTAWVGGTLGQTNAREETTRHVRRRNYSLGMVVGYQPETVQALLADGAAGTPQRFLWLSAIDPMLSLCRPDRPRRFSVPVCDGVGGPVEATIGGPEWLANELRSQRVEVVRGERVLARLDSHADLMRCKLAALLAVIDGRLVVADEDWQLAQTIWATSCAVRDLLTEVGREEARRDHEQRTTAYVEREARAHAARKGVDSQVERIGRWIGKRIHERGRQTKGDTKRGLSSDDRPFFDAGLEHAVAVGWVTVADRLLEPGSAMPV